MTIARIRPLGRDAERRATRRSSRTLVDLYDRGMREPLPLALPDLGGLRAGAPRRRDPAAAGRERVGVRRGTSTSEDQEPEHQLVLGGVRSVRRAARRAAARRRGRARAGTTRETTRFGRYARRLWDGLLAREEVTTGERARRRLAPFDVCGPLPTGVTVLEASAGTGKTYTIAALAARYVAEGTPLDELLLVTFTRMATGELRDRVRERLVSAEQGLDARARRRAAERRRRGRRSCSPTGAGDEVARCAATGSPARSPTSTRRRSPRRTASARRCSAASASPATSSRDTTFVEDLGDLRRGGRRRPLRAPLPPPRRRRRSTRAEALRIARVAVANPAAPIEPADAPDERRRRCARRLALRRPRGARAAQARAWRS